MPYTKVPCKAGCGRIQEPEAQRCQVCNLALRLQLKKERIERERQARKAQAEALKEERRKQREWELAHPQEKITQDRSTRDAAFELSSLRSRYAESLRAIDRLESEVKAIGKLGEGLATFKIEPVEGDGTSEGAIVLVASDWHVEENVHPGTVSGLNEFNLDIARERVTRFFQGGLRLVRLLQQDITISQCVLPLLGDFISNDIHEEFPENNEQLPMDAIVTLSLIHI